jgi:hypothetical protein
VAARALGRLDHLDLDAVGARRADAIEQQGDAVDLHLDVEGPALGHREAALEVGGDREVQEAAGTAVLLGRLLQGSGRFVSDGDLRDHLGRGLDAERLEELSGARQLLDDVAPADELALYVELGDRRPGRVGLDALADVRVREHVEGLVAGDVGVEDLDDRRREAALRRLRVALHEEHHVALLDQVIDSLAGGIVEAHRVVSCGSAKKPRLAQPRQGAPRATPR